MTRIKICGITNEEDARAAAEYGAHALGFIFVPDTPRYVGGSETLASLLRSVPPFVSRVAVCQNAADLEQGWKSAFQAIQFYHPVAEQIWHGHGGHSLLFAARVRDENSLQKIADDLPMMSTVGGDVLISALLLDTYHKDKTGGKWGNVQMGTGSGSKTAVRAASCFSGRINGGETWARRYAKCARMPWTCPAAWKRNRGAKITRNSKPLFAPFRRPIRCPDGTMRSAICKQTRYSQWPPQRYFVAVKPSSRFFLFAVLSGHSQ